MGDALGVPVEFRSREDRRRDPVVGMRGFGTHMQPAGTWSDDTSMTLVTAECLLDGYHPTRIMDGFRRWVFENHWTPRGTVFDIGGTTREAIFRYHAGKGQEDWGGRTENSNGNGSLMRILPVALATLDLDVEAAADRAAEVSALTHAHLRSRWCSAYYCLVVRGILSGRGLRAAAAEAAKALRAQVPASEERILGDLTTGAVFDRREPEVKSSGYVVHTLEAALWCCDRYPTYREAVLAAVNLGQDTDTTGAVAGGLAGVLHGRRGIPEEWTSAIARLPEVLDLVGRFSEKFGG